MSTQTDRDVEVDPQAGEPRFAHIVPPSPDCDGATLITRARVTGGTVTAYCGWTFTPSNDPRRFQTCETCERMFTMATGGATGGWIDA